MPTAVQYDLLAKIQAAIQGRGLTLIDGSSLAAANVVLQARPSNQEAELPPPPTTYPCVIVAPFQTEDLDPMAGTNLRDDIGYKIVVAILASKSDFLPPLPIGTALNTYLYWRESIRQLFHNQPLPNGGSTSGQSAYQVQVRPLAVCDAGAWAQRQIFASGLLLYCKSREARG